MCLRAGKRMMKRLLGVLNYRHARSMYDVTLDLEIEGKDEHLDFQPCVLFITSHCQAVRPHATATPFRIYCKCAEF
jgi:hypothetical protein